MSDAIDAFGEELHNVLLSAAKEAIAWQMADWGFGVRTAEGGFFDGDAGGVVWPPVSGPTPDITYGGETVNPWRDVYKPWIDALEGTFRDLDRLPEPGAFAPGVAALRRAAEQMTMEPGKAHNGEWNSANQELDSHVDEVERVLDQAQGDLVSTFNIAYGPSRMRDVFGEQRQAFLTLGYALQAEQDLWGRARDDVNELAREAHIAFTARAPGHPGGIVFSVVDALAQAVEDFVPEGAKKVIEAGRKVISTAIEDSRSHSKPAPPLSGGSAYEVQNNLVAAAQQLRANITTSESAVAQMCTDMCNAIENGEEGEPPDAAHRRYQIGTSRGLEKDFQDATELVVNPADLKRVGTAVVPDIAYQVTKAAEIALDADDVGIWTRPPGIGDSRAHQEFRTLLDRTYTVVTSSAAELVEAGEKLAVGAGYIGDVDAAVDKHLGDIRQHITAADSSGLGWEDDPRHGLPERTPRRHTNGPVPYE